VPQTEPDFDALRLRLSQLRSDREWSYDELSERSGVSRATLIAIETGTARSRRPDRPATRGSLDTWWRISNAFGIPFSDLVKTLG